MDLELGTLERGTRNWAYLGFSPATPVGAPAPDWLALGALVRGDPFSCSRYDTSDSRNFTFCSAMSCAGPSSILATAVFSASRFRRTSLISAGTLVWAFARSGVVGAAFAGAEAVPVWAGVVLVGGGACVNEADDVWLNARAVKRKIAASILIRF